MQPCESAGGSEVGTELTAFLDTLRSHELFERGSSITVARAPGRLDVMGGIADYSGSLVLQLPIAEATFAAAQRIERPFIEIVSLGRSPFTVGLNAVAWEYEEARETFKRDAENHWAAYVLGVLIVLARERSVRCTTGIRLVISSAVPEGKGVSSSAALEVSTMQAVTSALSISVDARDMAILCQKAENLIAGAPCGVMDQMTSACGQPDTLLALLCQPAELQSAVRIPDEIAFWGLDSGERHAVTGSDYGSVRTGAFMGQRIISQKQMPLHGYLANISRVSFDREFVELLPEQVSGAEFLTRYSGISDTVTTVDPSREYKVRKPTAHPIYENHRVHLFRELLLEPSSEQQRVQLGELMYASHDSYSACGLGSNGTQAIVDLVREEGPSNGLYGARITGGGCGGTVAVLGSRDAGKSIERVVAKYEKLTGYRPYVFSGSSPGATAFPFSL